MGDPKTPAVLDASYHARGCPGIPDMGACLCGASAVWRAEQIRKAPPKETKMSAKPVTCSCGGEARYVDVEHAVCCTNCGMQGPHRPYNAGGATRAWNKMQRALQHFDEVVNKLASLKARAGAMEAMRADGADVDAQWPAIRELVREATVLLAQARGEDAPL